MTDKKAKKISLKAMKRTSRRVTQASSDPAPDPDRDRATIDYMYGDDPILAEALKNCLEEY